MKRIIKGLLASVPMFAGTMFLSSCDFFGDDSQVVVAAKQECVYQPLDGDSCALIQYDGSEHFKVPSNVTIKTQEGSKLYYVREISYGAFNIPGRAENDILSTIVISPTVNKIADSVFDNCTELSAITVSTQSMYYRGAGVLTDQSGKTLIKYPAKRTDTSYTLPTSFETISPNAFKGNTFLEELVLSENISTIGVEAFSGCTSLKRVNLPSALKEIKKNTFKDCQSLDSVEILDEVTRIDAGAFQGSGLKDIIIPSNVTDIEHSAFAKCPNLKYVSISEGMTKISDNLFQDCTSLDEIDIPDSITKISKYAFAGCTSIKEITLPNSVTSMESNVFEGCTGLEDIKLSENLTMISKNSFTNCLSLISIDLPDSIANIDAYAFKGCKSLQNINLPKKLTKLGKGTFQECLSLGTIIIPEKIDQLSEALFQSSNIETLEINENLRNLSASALSKCSISELIINSEKVANEKAADVLKKLQKVDTIYVREDLQINNYITRNFDAVSKSDKEGYKEFKR